MTNTLKKVDNSHTVCYKLTNMFTQLFDSKAKRHQLTILLEGAVFCVSWFWIEKADN